MAIKMVRVPSETPNVSNIDDFIGLRYAYGNQNGYCIGKGRELDYQTSGSTFTVLSGRFVIQGVECDIDANGVSLTVDSVSGTRYHTVYAEVSLATMSASIKSLTSTVDYPEVDSGDDLTENTVGISRLPLYHLMSNSGSVTSVTKVVPSIEHTIIRPMTTVQIQTTGTESFELPLKPDTLYLMRISIPRSEDLEGEYTCLLFTPHSGNSSYFSATPMYAIVGNYSLLLVLGGWYYDSSYHLTLRTLNHYHYTQNKPTYVTDPVIIQYCEI